MFDLTGRIALVTGASGGLGQAIARALHAQGASVALTGTRREALETLAAELEARAHAAPCDLTDTAAVEALIPAVESALGPIDILVNNAGVTRDSLFIRMKDEDWDIVLAINLTAAFRLSRAVLKGMLKRRFGRIINITSVVGVQGNAGQGNYAAAKAGMIGMSKALAAEVATRGITVNCIAPGFIDSPMTRVLDQKQRDTILASIPTGRFGSDKEIGAAAVYLASSEIGLHDRADAACERRNGDDLMARTRPQDRGATGLAPSRVAEKDMLSTPVVAGRGRGASSERRRREPERSCHRIKAGSGRPTDGPCPRRGRSGN